MFKTLLDLIIPLLGIGIMIYYSRCELACSSLRGTFFGVDLKYLGFLFMALWIILSHPLIQRRAPRILTYLKTLLISGALGGEVILLRFQIIKGVYCPYCLIFAGCIVLLFLLQLKAMNRYLAILGFIAGLTAFFFFFQGSVVPRYTLFL